MTARLLTFCLGVLAVAASTGCSDPFAVKAFTETVEDTLVVFGLSGAPASFPTAVNLFVPRAVRTDPGADAGHVYDIVFDIHDDGTGTPAAYALPPRAVGPFGTTGIIKDTTQLYESITQAPATGYDDSTVVTIKPGNVLLLQAFSVASGCTGQPISARQVIYAKMVVDSINTSAYDPITNPQGNTIYLRMRVDPNCGFLSFADGIPTF